MSSVFSTRFHSFKHTSLVHILLGDTFTFSVHSDDENILVKKDSIQEQTSVIASNTYSASRSGSTSSSGTNVVYEGISEIGLSTTHTKGERWYTRETTRIIYKIWI